MCRGWSATGANVDRPGPTCAPRLPLSVSSRSLDIEEQERARRMLPSSSGVRAPIDRARKALDRLGATLSTAESELTAVRQRVVALEAAAHRDMDEASRLLAV